MDKNISSFYPGTPISTLQHEEIVELIQGISPSADRRQVMGSLRLKKGRAATH